MLRFKKILCPVDFDQNSLLALRLATELAKERGAVLRLLHVVAVPLAPEVALPFGRMESDARIKLERLAHRRVNREVRHEVVIMMGNPGVEVLQAAKRWGADVIVMATHGRKGLRHLVLGSVAEQVLREAPCPVLTVSAKTLPSGAYRRGLPGVRAKASRLRGSQ